MYTRVRVCATAAADRLFSCVDIEAVSEGGLERLFVVLSQFRHALVGHRVLVWNDAKHCGLGLGLPLTYQLDVGGASVHHAHIHCSVQGRERKNGAMIRTPFPHEDASLKMGHPEMEHLTNVDTFSLPLVSGLDVHVRCNPQFGVSSIY